MTGVLSRKGKRIAVIGASLGGLVAAAELKALGHEPVIIERGKTAGGLYNKVDTPFGVQEMGMHVVYVTQQHYANLVKIFGETTFDVMTGCKVDIGGSYNFGKTFFNSMYPCLLEHNRREQMLAEIVASTSQDEPPDNAENELRQRFGNTAASQIVAPILEKLWLSKSGALTRDAIHCFFDLRRVVVCDKTQADELKQNPKLDAVIANPDQLKPHGTIFGGRIGLTFRDGHRDLAEMVNDWCQASDISLQYGCAVTADQSGLAVNGRLVANDFDACLVTMPVHSFAAAFEKSLDQIELSVYYCQLDRRIKDEFPAYYILCHDSRIKSSRIVNYDAYHPRFDDAPSVIAIEVVHAVGEQPDISIIADELMQIVPGILVRDSYLYPATVKACVPSITNAAALDVVESAIRRGFGDKPVYFTGMRTDTGTFFSHHTIGLAYESALDIAIRLS